VLRAAALWAGAVLPVALLVAAGCGSSSDGRGEVTHTPRRGESPGEEERDPLAERRARFGALVVGQDVCQTDADCVPAACCHADACVGVRNAPDCAEVLCTQDCQFGTLDCGGRCLCFEGRCAARLSAPIAPQSELETGPAGS
jgi:hypothetical protein